MDLPLRAIGLVPSIDEAAPFDLNLPKGSITCVLGREPWRRSAYMRTLAGAEYPQQGEIEFFGKPLASFDDRAWLAMRRRVGYVTREAPLVSSMDGLRNVMLPALYHGLGKRGKVEIDARAWLTRLGFKGDLRLLPAYLTREQRRVIAIARALMLAPPLMLLDDPLHEWHDEQAHNVARVVANWCREAGATLLWATDDALFVREFADQLLFVASPAPQLFSSWQEFHDANDTEVERYLFRYRTEARAFD